MRVQRERKLNDVDCLQSIDAQSSREAAHHLAHCADDMASGAIVVGDANAADGATRQSLDETQSLLWQCTVVKLRSSRFFCSIRRSLV